MLKKINIYTLTILQSYFHHINVNEDILQNNNVTSYFIFWLFNYSTLGFKEYIYFLVRKCTYFYDSQNKWMYTQ
jgi:hypothetical protein